MSSCRRRSACALLLALLLLHLSACQRAPRFGSDFEHDGQLDRLSWMCRALFELSPEHATSGSRSLKISFFPAPQGVREHYPGIAFGGFDPSWSGHRAMAFDAFNPEDKPLPLALRIDDRRNPGYGDRFNREILLPPGESRILIPLAELVTSETKRTLKSHSSQAVMLFMVNPEERHTLYLDRLRLE